MAKTKVRKQLSKNHDVVESGKSEMMVMENLPALFRSKTFAKMMHMEKSFAAQVRKWYWLFPSICKRKDQAALTEIEKSRYICAFNMINNDGTLGQLVDLHHGNYNQHSSLYLLPWHRIFLMLFEEALHNYHPDVCIPYWDWTQQEQQHFPEWIEPILPTVHTPTRTINVVRSPGPESWLASIASGTSSAMAQTSYNTFSPPVNGIHGGVHIWVGGTMSDASVSPADPVFWLHHANLDRLWWEWYNSSAGNHQNPVIAGQLSPWTYAEADTRDIISLGYQYI